MFVLDWEEVELVFCLHGVPIPDCRRTGPGALSFHNIGGPVGFALAAQNREKILSLKILNKE